MSTELSNRATTIEALDQALQIAHDHYRRSHPKSESAHLRACRYLPGGNTRTVLHFDPYPFRVASARGPELIDIDGHRYVDFCGNYSAGLLGHSPAPVKAAIIEALDDGWAIGATHPREADLAERICNRFPSIDQVRFTNSGTEANLMAVGTALHHNGRSVVGVFDHGYHGGVLSFGDADGPHNALNVPHPFHVAPFDDISGLDAMFANPDLGCVLVEAVQGSGGCRPASPEFLAELRRRCDATGAVLIFDEVMTSRLAVGGAQERFGIDADLTTLGKYLGGGMTFGAFGGRSDIMGGFDPDIGGTLTQAGTFNNNVVTMAAAIATHDHVLDPDVIESVNARGDRFRNRLNDAFRTSGVPMWVTGMGSMVCIHTSADRLLELLFHHALDNGLYIARRGFMALSMAITDQHVDQFTDLVARWAPPTPPTQPIS